MHTVPWTIALQIILVISLPILLIGLLIEFDSRRLAKKEETTIRIKRLGLKFLNDQWEQEIPSPAVRLFLIDQNLAFALAIMEDIYGGNIVIADYNIRARNYSLYSKDDVFSRRSVMRPPDRGSYRNIFNNEYLYKAFNNLRFNSFDISDVKNSLGLDKIYILWNVSHFRFWSEINENFFKDGTLSILRHSEDGLPSYFPHKECGYREIEMILTLLKHHWSDWEESEDKLLEVFDEECTKEIMKFINKEGYV